MKRDNKYRFSLQFSGDTEEQMRVGELLESLGNRKSAVIVAALSSYMEMHPELTSPVFKIAVEKSTSQRREVLEQMIRHMIEERLSQCGAAAIASSASSEPVSASLDEDISQMLDNLDIFN